MTVDDRGDRQTIRILHVVGGMARGGIETWLMQILRHIDRDRFQMDFLVHTDRACAYDDEIRALGSQIIPCLYPSRPWIYASNFKRILREYDSYDIVHSHVHYFSGYVLRLAQQAGVPVRIAHNHTDTSSIDAKAGLYRRLYHTLSKWLVARHATFGLGGSRQSASVMFGTAWEADPRWQVLDYGIDLSPFGDPVNPLAVRAELGIPPDAIVIGHVGRFVKVKNHAFLIDIAAEVVKREPNVRLLLVGEGPLRPGIEQKVAQMGLSDRVIFAGVRSDVPHLMLAAMDIFLLPSLYEGRPLVLIESQAAGLPCIFSDVITKEVEAIDPLVQRLSLSQPASVWAEAILATKTTKPGISQSEALRLIEQSSFNILASAKELAKIYLSRSQ
jgi:glycosyltransferase involved in cell wall biosynthesis